MPTAFVTGATGFLGRHLIDVLLEENWTITAMVRDPKAASETLDNRVTLVKGDLINPSDTRKAMPDTLDCVFHAAADTSTWAKEARRQQLVNEEGTRSILQAVLDKNVKRMVHVSSIAVFGEHHEPITEETPRKGAKSWVSYIQTKSYAERKVKEAVDRGFDAVIVNPTHIVGRYDNHNWARLIQMMAEDTLPGTPPGGGNFANGRAVAEGIVAAFHKGKAGNNYILGGPKASFEEFLTIAADKIGKGAPKKPLPAWLLKTMASILSFISIFTGKRPMITPEEALFSTEEQDARSDKAISELGYRIVPLEQSIDESIEFLKENNLLKIK
ncbi:MAG: NAD-dependent epimerase/dehydratase family protein [Kordiimonas sp.]